MVNTAKDERSRFMNETVRRWTVGYWVFSNSCFCVLELVTVKIFFIRYGAITILKIITRYLAGKGVLHLKKCLNNNNNNKNNNKRI